MAKVYSVYNGAAVTTAAPVAVTTGTSVKTMIQLSTSASREARVVELWWEGSGSSAATPAVVELLMHASGAATVSSYSASDIHQYDQNSVATAMTLGNSNSGFTATAEGTVTSPSGDTVHQIPVTAGAYFQYPLGREQEMKVSTFCRLRNTVTPAVNAICGIAWEE